MKLYQSFITLSIISLSLVTCANNNINTPDIIKGEEAKGENIGTGESDGYKLVWEDLFTEGTLNTTSNWSVEVNGNGGGNNELQYYRRENISVGVEPVTNKKCLILTARKENFNGKTVTSGRLTTQGKFSTKYGKIEASIKLPKTANGLWPAFWMLGNDINTVGWPACSELDILEMGNSDGIRKGKQETLFNGACHWGIVNNGGYPNYAKASYAPYSLQDDFHLYTLIWDENKISCYLDKNKFPNVTPYFEMNINDKSSSSSPGNYFNKEAFIILNLAVGGNFTGIWDINNITALNNKEAKMYIDFVKVYQKK